MYQRASVLTGRTLSPKLRKIYSSSLVQSCIPNAPLCGRFFNLPPIPYLRCFDTPLGIGRCSSTRPHSAFPRFLPHALSPLANLSTPSANFGELSEWAYHADTACRKTPALGPPRTLQHSKSGCCPIQIPESVVPIRPRRCHIQKDAQA